MNWGGLFGWAMVLGGGAAVGVYFLHREGGSVREVREKYLARLAPPGAGFGRTKSQLTTITDPKRAAERAELIDDSLAVLDEYQRTGELPRGVRTPWWSAFPPEQVKATARAWRRERDALLAVASSEGSARLRSGSWRTEKQEPGSPEARAVAEYGTTDDPFEAGWILPDGTMIDLHRGQRSRVEHWQATGAIFSNERLRRNEDTMDKAFDRGWVRVIASDQSGARSYVGAQLRRPLTAAQRERLGHVLREARTFSVDLASPSGYTYQWDSGEKPATTPSINKALREANTFAEDLPHSQYPGGYWRTQEKEAELFGRRVAEAQGYDPDTEERAGAGPRHGGAGAPKSLDVSKAIDKTAGHVRPRVPGGAGNGPGTYGGYRSHEASG